MEKCWAEEERAFSYKMMQTNQLLAGMAKVDVTPQDPTGLTNLWRPPFEGVHAGVHLRALVDLVPQLLAR